MKENNKNISILPYMAYADALGFLRENTGNEIITELKHFSYSYSEDIKLKADKGQWSYITQLMLINCKCLVDSKDKRQVSIDYKRMLEEIKLWQYYRCDTPLNYIYKLNLGKKYYENEFYWNDKRGHAFSRIIPIVLANKNFNSAQEEVYKNIIYINRHPQVVLTGLLLLRATYFLINNTLTKTDELIDDLKNYLIHLQLIELEKCVNKLLPGTYKIKFEQEKINYLIDLDRTKDKDITNIDHFSSKGIFIQSLVYFFKLFISQEDRFNCLDLNEKEIYVITYALLALTNKKDKIAKIEIDQVKDIDFIKNMDVYLIKLREYEVNRRIFEKTYNEIELFNLNKGSVLKHPLLNNIRIKEKIQNKNYTQLIVESKSGEYKFIKK